MAAERVFYGENSTGVGGDVQMATTRAALMVGACAMGPERPIWTGNAGRRRREEGREKIMKRFEGIGLRIMHRASGGGRSPPTRSPACCPIPASADRRAAPWPGVHGRVRPIIENRDGVEKVAEVLVERRRCTATRC